jgi:Chromo (CHRromatin Organisation MOdifier) domain
MYGKHPRVSWDDADVEAQAKRQRGTSGAAVRDILLQLPKIRGSIAERLRKAQEAQAKYYDKTRIDVSFNVGEPVLISTKNLKLARPKKSLCPKYIGPLTVVEPVGPNAYRLKLPENWNIHDVINVSRLEKWHPRAQRNTDDDDALRIGLPDVVELDGEGTWEVEAILDRQWDEETGILHYHVRWAGNWSKDQETWEPLENLRGISDLIAKYDAKHPRTKRPVKNNLMQKYPKKRKTK